MPDTIDTSELERLQRALANLVGPGLAKFKKNATYYVAVELRGRMQRYPQGHHQPVIWPSEKARRHYFAMRREAGLPLAYKRGADPMSQRMQTSWTIRKGATEATVGSKATYAPYVQSSQYQTAQHKASGWITDVQAADDVISDGTMNRIIDATLSQVIRDSLRRWSR